MDNPPYTPAEEAANAVTHGLGALFGMVAVVLLAVFSALCGDAWHVLSCTIYGITLVLLYTASTLYHSLRNARLKRAMKVVDHASIFLLIAGTYTPFLLVSLRGSWGWSLFAVVWGLALAGIVMETTRLRRFRAVLIGLYVVMGWSVVAAVKPMLANVEPGGLWLLLAGGLAYTGGIGFYLWRRLPYNHAIWHLFVLAGSILHYFAVLFYIIPVMAD